MPALTGELNSASEVAKSFLISKTKLPSMLVLSKKAANFWPFPEKDFVPLEQRSRCGSDIRGPALAADMLPVC